MPAWATWAVLLAGTAADPHPADDLAVDHDGQTAAEGRDLTAAGRRRMLEGQVQQGVRMLRAGRDRPGRLSERRGGRGLDMAV